MAQLRAAYAAAREKLGSDEAEKQVRDGLRTLKADSFDELSESDASRMLAWLRLVVSDDKS